MNFKVGQRVWDIKKKRFDTIEEIMYESYVLKSDIRYAIEEDNLHETADDMFEELGWEYIEKSTPVNNRKIATYYRNGKTIIFEPTLGGKNVWGVPETLSVEEHQAIHQKLIEMGWIE